MVTADLRAAALLVLLAGAGDAGADPGSPADSGILGVEVRLDRERVYVHEQVVLEVRVAHRLHARPRWAPPPFDGFWSERLPTQGGPLEHDERGEAFRTTSFRRALFPTRPGRLRIAESRIEESTETPGRVQVEAPAAGLEVRALPQTGRPPGFLGLVGDFEIRIRAIQDEVRAGRALSVTIDIFGVGNVWDAPDPALDSLLGPGVEVFASRTILLAGERNGRLTSRRRFPYDLVPREAGRYQIPALHLDVFDPVTGRYRSVSSQAFQFRALRAAPRPAPPPWESSTAVPRPRSAAFWIAVLGGLLVCFGLTAAALARWDRRPTRGAAVTRPAAPEALLRQAAGAAGGDAFAALLATAVRAGLGRRHRLDATSLTTTELEARIDDAEAIDLLRRLDEARFHGQPCDAEALLASARRCLS